MEWLEQNGTSIYETIRPTRLVFVGLSDVVHSKYPNKFYNFKQLILWHHHFKTLCPFPLPSEHLLLWWLKSSCMNEVHSLRTHYSVKEHSIFFLRQLRAGKIKMRFHFVQVERDSVGHSPPWLQTSFSSLSLWKFWMRRWRMDTGHEDGRQQGKTCVLFPLVWQREWKRKCYN